jgi:serine phosphatase RsbU (regulator of sigma subunit)
MAVEAGLGPVAALAEAGAGVAAAGDLRSALDVLAGAARSALGADVVVLRVLDAEGRLEARAVAPGGSALGAELAATHVSADAVVLGRVPEPALRAAVRARAAGTLAVPALVKDRIVGSIEAVRVGSVFEEDDRLLAGLAATQLALAVRSHAPDGGTRSAWVGDRMLGLAGDALAAGGDVHRAARQAVRIAVDAAGARAGALWRRTANGAPELAWALGLTEELTRSAAAIAEASLRERPPPAVLADPRLPVGLRQVAALPLGQPPAGVLQLFFPDGSAPSVDELAALASFAARSAHALREGERFEEQGEELARTRALLRVVGEASSRLSLAHTLDTAVERLAQLLPLERLGLYLRDDDRLRAAAGRSLPPRHLEVARTVLASMLGPLRARSSVHVNLDGREPGLERLRDALQATGEPGVVAVPLQVRDDLIGLLIAYPKGGDLADTDASLLAALAGQLAVAVQNAKLHEQSQQLSQERSTALRSARDAGRRLGSLYDISNAFTRSLSLERTAEAIATTVVDALGVDAAVIRVPDARGDVLVPRAVHVADERLRQALGAVLSRPQAFRARRQPLPELLDADAARRLGGGHALLVPFLAQGSSAAVVPIAAKGELLAEVTIISLDPADPIGAEVLTTARSLAQQAALALENARLHEQLRHFAETMRRSLLPQEPPSVPGLDVGHRYESAAQVEVGGDVFDFLELPDGRLAVVLGDVTGHGIDAAADMAMGKFVFRSLARRHAEPPDFLAHANDVVFAEIAGGAFITMAYLTADSHGRIACASAGHPRPRLLHADGSVEELRCRGLALGIAEGQEYDQVQLELGPGDAVFVYTDGLVEARRDGELYGIERLDTALASARGLGAQELADALVADCRAFSGGELVDDCAIVVIRRP